MRHLVSSANAGTDDTWLLIEQGWKRASQLVRESQFALGNGLLGSRGVLEEIPAGCTPGTFIAGVYDRLTARVSELVNLPNPFNFKFTADGEKVGVLTMDVLEHERVLNMARGVLARRTVYQDARKRRYEYGSLRFLSMHDKNVGVMQITLTPLDGPVKELAIETRIDTSVYNRGMLTEGRKKHFRLREAGQSDGAGLLIVETLEKKFIVIYRSGFYYQIGRTKTFAEDNIFQLSLRKRQTITLTKVVHISRVPHGNDLARAKRSSEKRFRLAFKTPCNRLLQNHVRTWEALWEKADVKIEGSSEVQRDLRFNIYHMLTCAHDDDGSSSIGARDLSGEGYRGHIFWDAEVFLLPFYTYTIPEVARNMLLYRYKRLAQAREHARSNGYRGAQFPWESADTGEEETPTWAKNIDGRISKILTDKFEHHITADIAFSYYQYYVATGDESFMEDYGYEVLFETARFWASRVAYDRRNKVYVIRHVIGPDEFHEDVNNNAYTNMMAKWNLRTAYKAFLRIQAKKPRLYAKLADRLALTPKEARQWRRIATRMYVNRCVGSVIEQFDGFFRKKRILLKECDENGLPLIPKRITSRVIGKTQLVKQADVVMLLYLLSDAFSPETKRKNYEFYMDRTVHKSSLSPSTHAIMAAECGDANRAYQCFRISLRADVRNLHHNTMEGVHAASLGGTWQAAVNGFAGVRVKKGTLSVDPKLPDAWDKMAFTLKWRRADIHLEVKNRSVRVDIVAKSRQRVELQVFGEKRLLSPNRKYMFTDRRGKIDVHEYY